MEPELFMRVNGQLHKAVIDPEYGAECDKCSILSACNDATIRCYNFCPYDVIYWENIDGIPEVSND